MLTCRQIAEFQNILSLSHFSPEDGSNMFLRNACICLQVHMVSHSRRWTLVSLSLSKLQNTYDMNIHATLIRVHIFVTRCLVLFIYEFFVLKLQNLIPGIHWCDCFPCSQGRWLIKYSLTGILYCKTIKIFVTILYICLT